MSEGRASRSREQRAKSEGPASRSREQRGSEGLASGLENRAGVRGRLQV